jgi:hypothetical protein
MTMFIITKLKIKRKNNRSIEVMEYIDFLVYSCQRLKKRLTVCLPEQIDNVN